MKTTNVLQAAVANDGVSDDAQEMTIDTDSSVFLMDALGKLYSQPARAALREYLSNAIDAHIEAGGKRPPIEIELPTHNKMTLSIRDYGKGMSEDNFNNVLSRYGASTKRNSNKVHGGFGLGAKAGFAITDSFNMTSYQNGKLVKVRIFKNESGKGFIEVIERSNTSLADGLLVEVDIPASNFKELSNDSLTKDKFFSAYRGTEIKVTGHQEGASWNNYGSTKSIPIEELSFHNPEYYDVLEYGGSVIGWVSKKRTAYSEPIQAVIGRVVYSITPDHNVNYSRNNTYSDKFGSEMQNLHKFSRQIVLNIPIGSVDLPSSREEITYSARSLKTIMAVATSAYRMVEESVQRSINEKATGYEALCAVLNLSDESYWKAGEVTWKGKDLPLSKSAPLSKFSDSANIIRFLKTSHNRGSFQMETVTSCRPDVVRAWGNGAMTLMIVAKDMVEYQKSVSRIKTNINDYFKAKGSSRSVQVFFFAPDEPLTEWFSQGEKISLEEFLAVGKAYRAERRAETKALAAARAANLNLNPNVVDTVTVREIPWIATASAELNGSATYLTISGETEALVGATNFYYLSRNEVKEASNSLANLFPTISSGQSKVRMTTEAEALLRALNKILGADSKIVFLAGNRNMDKFKETYPNIPSVIEAVQTNLKAEWDEIANNGKKDSYLSALFWLTEHKTRTKSILVQKFMSSLSLGEVQSLNADLQEIHSYLGSRTAESKNLFSLANELLGWSFGETIIEWVKSKITKLDARYPLLTNLNTISADWKDSPAMRNAMMGYLKTC